MQLLDAVLIIALCVAILFAITFYVLSTERLKDSEEYREYMTEYQQMLADEASRHAGCALEKKEWERVANVATIALRAVLVELENPKVFNRLPIRFVPIRNVARQAVANSLHVAKVYERPTAPAVAPVSS